MSGNSKKILVCPLAWGAGHTTRMIPVVRELMAMGHKVIFGGEKWQNELISREVPGIHCIYFPGFTIRYSASLPQYAIIILYLPLFIWSSIREHFVLKKIIREYEVEIVISDSRPGLWNRNLKSALVTHMLRIPFPGPLKILENGLLPVIRAVTGKFSYCFVPDLPGDLNLSGKLSHNLPLPPNVRYTGILSRFGPHKEKGDSMKEYHCVALMSGPPPQKELLADIVSSVLSDIHSRSFILGCAPSPGRAVDGKNLSVITAPCPEELVEKIHSGRIIISRPGYTTLMELFSLGRSALLIPTPGQPEQEYLADYLAGRGWCEKVQQNRFGAGDISAYTEKEMPLFPAEENRELLLSALSELTDQQHNCAYNSKPGRKAGVNLGRPVGV